MTGLRAMRGRRADRGVTVVQLAIAMPVVLVLIMSVIQYALFEFANQVAEAAATEGLQAATAQSATWIISTPCSPTWRRRVRPLTPPCAAGCLLNRTMSPPPSSSLSA